VDISLGVSYRDDLERAKRVAMEAVSAVPARLSDREVELFYEEFAESSIDFTVRFWIPFETQRDYLAARSDAIIRIKQAFDANGITIPFPTRTLKLARQDTPAEDLSDPAAIS
jgi:small-conductance mechanosensitive channel